MRLLLQTASASLLLASFAGEPPIARAQEFVGKSSARVQPKSETLQISTRSDAAREAFAMGMTRREDLLFVEDGIGYFRLAVKADPKFALGHAALSYFTTNPQEGRRERALASRYLSTATPDEKVLIRWLNGTRDGQVVSAIAAMNDLLEKYPSDKRLQNMFGEWLCAEQQNYIHGAEILERLLSKDPNYFPALNNLAYCYALGGKLEKAPPLMDRYVVALPGEPNPQDSYAEILRMSGNFPAALEHYRAALKISPVFTSSQVGIASTYALMGDQQHAREEYAKAFDMTKDPSLRLGYKMLWAMTYYREGQPRLARKAYSDLDAEAHHLGLVVQEAEIHRTMALFNPDYDGAMHDLDAAQADLSSKTKMDVGEHDTELASVLQTRAFIAARAGKADEAQKALEPLAAMAQTSRYNLVQQSFYSANGAAFFAKGEYAEAIVDLQEDPRNPLSLALLADAQAKAGQAANSQNTLETLAAINDERVETAFAVPQARAALKAAPAISAMAAPR